MAKSPQPFQCTLCNKQSKKNFFIFPATETWLAFYPDRQTVHLHFGRSTWTPEESTAQGKWVYEHFAEAMQAKGKSPWFVAVDMSRLDDSTFPSNEAKDFYKKVLQMPQVHRVVFYGSSTSLAFLIKMILRFSASDGKADIVHREYEVEELYQQWQESVSARAT